jgi:hypothetical protein
MPHRSEFRDGSIDTGLRISGGLTLGPSNYENVFRTLSMIPFEERATTNPHHLPFRPTLGRIPYEPIAIAAGNRLAVEFMVLKISGSKGSSRTIASTDPLPPVARVTS